MTPNFMNISLTLAGLILIILFYLPMFKHLVKNTKQFVLYLIFWFALLALITSITDYVVFSKFRNDAILKQDNRELEV